MTGRVDGCAVHASNQLVNMRHRVPCWTRGRRAGYHRANYRGV